MRTHDWTRPAPEVAPGVRLLPVVHDRLEMAMVTHRVLQRLQPEAVAVELPSSLEPSVMAAVGRLPRISLVLSEAPGEEPRVWICAPADPFSEALRWALEHQRPVFLIDPDHAGPEPASDPVPDPYSVWTLEAADYLELLAESLDLRGSGPEQQQREAGMAYQVQQAGRQVEGTLLVLVGAAHFHPLSRRLTKPAAQPLARVRQPRQEIRHVVPRSLSGILPDPPLAHAAYELLREGNVPSEAEMPAAVRPQLSWQQGGVRALGRRGPEDRLEQSRQVARWAAARAARLMDGHPFPDRRRLARVVWELAAHSYRSQTQEHLQPWQQRTYLQFLRRYCRLQGLLAGGLYEWVVAARGVGDDNLAWEAFDTGRCYPWQLGEAEIPTAEVDGDLLDLGTRKIRFRRRFFRVKRRPVPVKRRADQDDPDTWLEGFDNPNICSYPPEDLVIEDYARFLQQKAVSLLSVERKRTEPFSTSLLDGIDLRETLRNHHLGEVYVQEFGRLPGGVGSVVVIFDRDLAGATYPYRMTWLGEHDQESDMAFYSTDPAAQVVGPGIMRATYGGMMMTYPPRRLFDVWLDPEYRGAREKAEVLLMAAVDYSREKMVVHLAASPPSPALHQYASARGKKILHVPLGSVSPVTLKKIRVVHLLAGHDKRQIAKDYVW